MGGPSPEMRKAFEERRKQWEARRNDDQSSNVTPPRMSLPGELNTLLYEGQTITISPPVPFTFTGLGGSRQTLALPVIGCWTTAWEAKIKDLEAQVKSLEGQINALKAPVKASPVATGLQAAPKSTKPATSQTPLTTSQPTASLASRTIVPW
jgi:hypothetical protein